MNITKTKDNLWKARVTYNYEVFYLGSYKDESEALEIAKRAKECVDNAKKYDLSSGALLGSLERVTNKNISSCHLGEKWVERNIYKKDGRYRVKIFYNKKNYGGEKTYNMLENAQKKLEKARKKIKNLKKKAKKKEKNND